MAVSSLADIVRNPQTRIGRALRLLDEHGDDIRKVAPFTWVVPSATDEDTYYRVSYGGNTREWCTCEDFFWHGHEESCKHLLAVGAKVARRRARRGC